MPPKPSRRPWSRADDKLLGKMTDQAIADRTGRHLNTVARRRKKLGIPPFVDNSACVWTKAELRLLGRLPDSQVAKQLGLARLTVLWKRAELKIAAASAKNVPKQYRRRKRIKRRPLA